MLWTIAADSIILFLALRALKGDLSACAGALLYYSFLNGMTGASVVTPLWVIVGLSVIALFRLPRGSRQPPLRVCPESLLLGLGGLTILVAVLELAAERSALRGGDYHTFTRGLLCGTILPPTLLAIAATRSSAFVVIQRFATATALATGLIMVAAMLGWLLEPQNDLGISYGRHRFFGTDTITSGSLIVLCAASTAISLPAVRWKWVLMAGLLLCVYAVYLVGNTQSLLAVSVLLALLYVRMPRKLRLALVALVLVCAIFAIATQSRPGMEESPERVRSDAISRLEKIPDEFGRSETLRFGQFLESFDAALENPVAGGGFNTWRRGESFATTTTDRFGQQSIVERTGYPHGVIPSLLNDRGLIVSLLATFLLAIVLLRAVRCVCQEPLTSPKWSAAVFVACLPFAGTLFSSVYWTAGALAVALMLAAIAASAASPRRARPTLSA